MEPGQRESSETNEQTKVNKTIYKICRTFFLKFSHCADIFVYFIDAIVVVIAIEMWNCRHCYRSFGILFPIVLSLALTISVHHILDTFEWCWLLAGIPNKFGAKIHALLHVHHYQNGISKA